MLLVTAADTKSTTTNSQMDAHYDFQIRQQHQPSTLHKPARQFGSGGIGAFAIRMGRVAMPLMKKNILPVVREFGRNFVSSFVPELASLVSGKKRTRKAVREVLKNSATKIIANGTGTRRRGGRRSGCRRYRRAGGRPAGRAPPARKGATSVKTSPVHVVVPHHHHPSAKREVILKKSPAKKSRSDILSKINFS